VRDNENMNVTAPSEFDVVFRLQAETTAEKLCWYAVRVRPRAEKAVAAELGVRSYETFLPLCRCIRQWSDREKALDLPLFPGYLFCRFASRRIGVVLSIPGVIQVVGIGPRPVAVLDEEITAVRTLIASGFKPQPHPYLRAGQRVRIREGALAGLEGILVRSPKVDRLVVSVELLQRSVAVEIDRGWAVPIPGNVRGHIEAGLM
jgi:transcription antitermination factor NusG